MNNELNMERFAVTTTTGRRFSGEKTARLAALIYERFGYETPAAASAWRRMLGNTCTDADFVQLAQLGQLGMVP
jgi:hypothetical protein